MVRGMETTIITRSKLYPAPGSSYRFAWRWLYKVNGDHACDTLSQARGIAKRLYPNTVIVEAWKTSNSEAGNAQ